MCENNEWDKKLMIKKINDHPNDRNTEMYVQILQGLDIKSNPKFRGQYTNRKSNRYGVPSINESFGKRK